MTHESLDQWIARIEVDERLKMELPTETRRRERGQKLRNIRRYLKKDERSTEVTHIVQRLTQGRKRQQALHALWKETHANPFTQAQGEYLTIRGQRLSEYICSLDEERRGEESVLHAVQKTLIPRHPGDR
jgi:hypothetical protein